MRKPVYYVRDVDLIKRLTIKDFEYFEDRSTVVNEDIDQLFGNSMFLMRGEKWRHMRSTLSPAFTGSKMRQMFELVSECASDLVQSLLKQSANSKSINWEMKELFTRYSNDVIASCAFGIKVNSLENVNNEFYQIGRKSLDFSSVKQVLKFLMARVIPFVMKTLKIEIVDGKVIKFFRSMVITTMNVREQEKIYRPDMINILMRYRNGVSSAGPIEDNSTLYDGFATVQETLIARINIKDNWSEKELIAQCFLFYLAAFETTSTQLAFLAYELIVNPGIQEHLYNEIIETDASLNGNHINYDALQKMKYMDQVISEVLRKWPSSANLDRICVKDYVYNDNQSLNLRIDKGSPLIIPIYGIHHDPQYYPEPEIFNPDRFSVENRQKIVVGSYLPFGIGPRNCIGNYCKPSAIHIQFLFNIISNISFQVHDLPSWNLKRWFITSYSILV